MHCKPILLAIAATLPLSVVGQDAVLHEPAAVVRQASSLPTAIVPFGTLPTCAQVCGPLFDAQGACSPPHISTVDTKCFCSYTTLQPFYQGAAGVCSATASGACTGNDLLTVRNWFVGLCGSGSAATTVTSGTATTPTGAATGTTSAAGTTGTTVPATGGTVGSGSGGTWLDSHWKYVVMIVVIVVGIVVIWVAACLFRRRHLRKKDLQYELRPPAVPWAEGQLKAGPPYGFSEGAVAHGAKGKDPMRYGVTPGEVEAEKASRKKWIVKERT